MSEKIAPQITSLNKKRLEIEKLLEKYDLSFLSGSATFYMFIDTKGKIKDTNKFVLDLLEKENISLIPGKAYGKHTSQYLRLSFGVEPLDRIEQAVKTLKGYL